VTKIIALIMSFACLSLFAGEPGVYKNIWNGVTMGYTANSGTNSVLEVGATNIVAVPYRLSEVTATTNGVATETKIYRVEAFGRERYVDEVYTNFASEVETNTIDYGTTYTYSTNLVYDSTSSTLPVASWFLPKDILRADFQSVTNVQFRVIGTAQ